MQQKVISILQPWASLLITGHKKIETRSWNTEYRGKLLIHASAGKNGIKTTAVDFYDLYSELGINSDNFPFGAIIGSLELCHVLPTEKIKQGHHFSFGPSMKWNFSKQELAFGDYSPNRYGWLLSNPVVFKNPIPAKGQLGIWNWESKTYKNIFCI